MHPAKPYATTALIGNIIALQNNTSQFLTLARGPARFFLPK